MYFWNLKVAVKDIKVQFKPGSNYSVTRKSFDSILEQTPVKHGRQLSPTRLWDQYRSGSSWTISWNMLPYERKKWRTQSPLSKVTERLLHFDMQVLAFGSPLIAYEVVLTIQRLVNKFGKDLIHMAWETILDILLKLLHQSEVSSSGFQQSVNVFESLGKVICHFQGLENLWKMNNSSEVFENLWSLTAPAKLKSQKFPFRITS